MISWWVWGNGPVGVRCQVLDVDPEVQKIPQAFRTTRNWGYCFLSLLLRKFHFPVRRTHVALAVKKPPANAEDVRDLGLILGCKDYLE